MNLSTRTLVSALQYRFLCVFRILPYTHPAKAWDVLSNRGWIAIRRMPFTNWFVDRNERLHGTQSQLNRVYDVMVKFDFETINGLDELMKDVE